MAAGLRRGDQQDHQQGRRHHQQYRRGHYLPQEVGHSVGLVKATLFFTILRTV